MNRLHLHLVSDSTGETLEMIAKAALAQFEDPHAVRHFWPMVRSRQHLDRIVPDLAANPGLVLFTLVNAETRARLEEHCRQLGLPAVPALDAVTAALESQLGQEAHGRPGRQHLMDEAYFKRVEAIQFTIAHDDGIGWENWEEADILLAGVSRSLKNADQHLSRQSRLQSCQYSFGGGKPAAQGAVRIAPPVGGGFDHRA